MTTKKNVLDWDQNVTDPQGYVLVQGGQDNDWMERPCYYSDDVGELMKICDTGDYIMRAQKSGIDPTQPYDHEDHSRGFVGQPCGKVIVGSL